MQNRKSRVGLPRKFFPKWKSWACRKKAISCLGKEKFQNAYSCMHMELYIPDPSRQIYLCTIHCIQTNTKKCSLLRSSVDSVITWYNHWRNFCIFTNSAESPVDWCLKLRGASTISRFGQDFGVTNGKSSVLSTRSEVVTLLKQPSYRKYTNSVHTDPRATLFSELHCASLRAGRTALRAALR